LVDLQKTGKSRRRGLGVSMSGWVRCGDAKIGSNTQRPVRL
jgi:hypothetical protein